MTHPAWEEAYWDEVMGAVRRGDRWRLYWSNNDVSVVKYKDDDGDDEDSSVVTVWRVRSGPSKSINPADLRALRLARLLNDPLSLACIKACGRLKGYPTLRVDLL